MTNNINDIDVSECGFNCWKHNGNELIEDYCSVFDNKCIYNPDCYFKQLKRLQEENKSLQMLSCANCGEKYLSPDGAELYDKNVQLQKENEAYKLSENEAKEIIAELKYKNKDYLKQLDALKPENVYLHKTIKKYEQTLKEIREISEPVKKDICNNCGWQDSDCCEPEGCACNEFITILHKIDEVINEK